MLLPRKSPVVALKSPRSPLLKRGAGGDFAECHTFHAHKRTDGAWGMRASTANEATTGSDVTGTSGKKLVELTGFEPVAS